MADFNADGINSIMDAEIAKMQPPPVIETSNNEQVDTTNTAAETTEIIPATTEVITPEIKDNLSELLKELNLQSADDIKALVTKATHKEETTEEKEQKQKIYQANLDKFAQEKGIMTRDEIIKYETLKAKQDSDLVFEKYLTEWKEENADVNAEDADALAKADFESEYKLNSENEKAKAKGLAKLSKEANELRSPYVTKYENAKTDFEAEEKVKATLPTFHTYIKKSIESLVKDEIKVFEKKIDNKVLPFSTTLTKEDKEQIITDAFAEFNKLPYYSSFLNEKETLHGKNEWIERNIGNFIEAQVFKKTQGQVFEKVWQEAAKVGKAQGSTAGATVPFAVAQTNKNNGSMGGTVDAEKQMLESLQRLQHN